MFRFIWLFFGFFFLGLGTLGIFLPILPTVPFYLLTLFCFSRGSKRINDWFVETKVYKKYVGCAVKNREMNLKAKIFLIFSFSFFMGIGFYCMRRIFWGRILLFLVWLVHIIYFIFGIKTVFDKE